MRSVCTSCRRYAFLLAFTTAACPNEPEGPGIVNAPVVVSVTVNPPSPGPIDIGETLQLNATVEVQNGAATGVLWSSSAPNVATVGQQTGVVTGVSAGQATITATSTHNPTKTGSATVTVNGPGVIGVTLNSGARTIRVGESFALDAMVETRGTVARTVTFTSSNVAVATVSTTDGLTANVVGVGIGQTTITARSTADVSKTASIQVTGTGTVRITGVTPSPVSLRVAGQIKLTPTVQADPGLSTAVTFQSQNQAVATVATDGTVTAVSLGQTSVVVTAVADPTQRVTVPVAVRSGVISVSLTPDVDSLRPTLTRQLSVSVNVDPGVSNAVSVSSSIPSVVTVDANLRATGVSPGAAYVRALSTIDPSVGDSSLIVVVDPCQAFTPLPIGTTVNGVISDASCLKTRELFTFTVTSQTLVAATVTLPFIGRFFLGTLGTFNGNTVAPSTETTQAVMAPGTYIAAVETTDIAQRGAFSFALTVGTSLGNCVTRTTAGVTLTVSLSACGLVPDGRPAGTYNSYSFSVMHPLTLSQPLKATVTATGFIPLIEATLGSNIRTQSIAPGTNQVEHTVVAQPNASGSVFFFVTSRDPGQLGTFTVKIEGPNPGAAAAVRGPGATGVRR